jgi:mono/diheme cytochrome c family protein
MLPRVNGSLRRLAREGALVTLGALAVVVLAACSDVAGPERELDGKQIYDRNCARCHGFDGRGTPEVPAARDLSNAFYMATMDDRRLERAIRAGKPPGMPAFGNQFMEPSMQVLVKYVRSLSEQPQAPAMVPRDGAKSPAAKPTP